MVECQGPGIAHRRRKGAFPTSHRGVVLGSRPTQAPTLCNINGQLELVMGKYVIAWLLGVPAIVLVVVYFFFS